MFKFFSLSLPSRFSSARNSFRRQWVVQFFPTQSVQSLAGGSGRLSIFPDTTCSMCFTLEVGVTICAEWKCLVVEFASKVASYAIAGSSPY